MTPYTGPLVGRATEVLNHWSQAPTNFESFVLWKKLLEFIKQSSDLDDGGKSITRHNRGWDLMQLTQASGETSISACSVLH